jgi:ubiquinone/menaquinone biosynthesis C-methylase UbiE
VLGELFRVLRPGGRLVIATMGAPLPAPSLRRWWLYGPMGRALRRVESTGDSQSGLYQMSRGFRPPS